MASFFIFLIAKLLSFSSSGKLEIALCILNDQYKISAPWKIASLRNVLFTVMFLFLLYALSIKSKASPYFVAAESLLSNQDLKSFSIAIFLSVTFIDFNPFDCPIKYFQ